MLYVGKVSRPTYWKIIERIRGWQRWSSLERVAIKPIVQSFSHVPTTQKSHSDIAYAPVESRSNIAYSPVDGNLEGLHSNLRTMLVPEIVKKVEHVNTNDCFTPHVTLQYLYGKQRTNKRIQAKLDKIADAISGDWKVEMLHVDWGDVHRVAITLSGAVYQES
jgi:hypothetical protein